MNLQKTPAPTFMEILYIIKFLIEKVLNLHFK